MLPAKPTKTLADWLVISLSPALIMLLVGSLCFFLIEVFYRGQAEGSVRWVMFWFVLAVVLVSRIGIEQGTRHAAAYGIMLALATWFYLVRIHPAFLLGALLLGIVWWCAHKLTWDCTLIDEDEDASGGGLLQTAYNRKSFQLFGKKSVTRDPPGKAVKPTPTAPHPPGHWVVWFSLAALPLFGIGQMFLPPADLAARHSGFICLLVYVTAALGLLLTTSFLGLRRYLRQRYLTMPGLMAFGWIRFGAGVAVLVLVGALLLPRPGATAAWQSLGYHIDYKLRQASAYAASFSPHGKGPGQTGNQLDKSAPQPNATDPSGTQKTPGQSEEKTPDHNAPSQSNPPPSAPPDLANNFYHWLSILFLLAVAGLAAWWVYRNRELLLSMVRSLLAALRQFFADLFRWGQSPVSAEVPSAPPAKPKIRRFAAFQNPFLTGKDATWPTEQLLFYSYEALQAWAGEQGITLQPNQTALEFCVELGGRYPEITPELRQFSNLYGQAAYGMSVPAGVDLESVKKVWRYLAGA